MASKIKMANDKYYTLYTKRYTLRNGSAMALVLLAVVILLVMGTGLLSLGLHGRMLGVRTSSEITARCAADAGLTKAIFEMNEKLKVTPWDGNSLPQSIDEALLNCDATLSYTVTGDVNNGYAVVSIGSSGWAERSINTTLRLQGPFEYAILAVEGLDIKNNNLVTGYNPYTGETNLKAEIGTASTTAGAIQLGLGTTINGDVIVGVGGDPDTVIVNDGIITGGTYAASKKYIFPSITAPVLPDMGTIDVDSTTMVLTPADNGQYAGIIANNQSILEIDGGDVVLYVTGNINMNNLSEIQIKDGSSLTIYTDGNISCLNSSGVNNLTGFTRNFKVYSTGSGEQLFEIQNNSSVFGLVYGPNVNVTIMNGAKLYGSVVAKTFSLQNNGTFYYDVTERNIKVDDEAVRFVIERWQEG
jgi:hypothetical protein